MLKNLEIVIFGTVFVFLMFLIINVAADLNGLSTVILNVIKH